MNLIEFIIFTLLLFIMFSPIIFCGIEYNNQQSRKQKGKRASKQLSEQERKQLDAARSQVGKILYNQDSSEEELREAWRLTRWASWDQPVEMDGKGGGTRFGWFTPDALQITYAIFTHPNAPDEMINDLRNSDSAATFNYYYSLEDILEERAQNRIKIAESQYNPVEVIEELSKGENNDD